MARAKRLGSRFTPTLVWAAWDQLWRHSSSSTISAAQDHAWTPTRNKPRSGKRKERSDRYAVLYHGRAWNKATLHLFRAGRRLPGFPPSEDRVRWTDQLPGFVSVLACPNHMPATGAGIGKKGQNFGVTYRIGARAELRIRDRARTSRYLSGSRQRWRRLTGSPRSIERARCKSHIGW